MREYRSFIKKFLTISLEMGDRVYGFVISTGTGTE
jgi:hypothetical protein